MAELGGRNGVSGFESDPFGAGEIGRGNDARALGEFKEGFGRCFESEPDARRLESKNREDSAAHLEDQTLPLEMLGGIGEGKAEFAERANVHGEIPRGAGCPD